MKIKILSWNVNGSKNIIRVPSALRTVKKNDVIFLQETFELDGGRKLSLPGFVHFGNCAVSTGGRPSGGVSTHIRASLLANCSARRIVSPVPWILPLRVDIQGHQPMVLVNIYVPRFSINFSMGDVEILRNFLFETKVENVGCAFIYGGDWNADFFRTQRVPVEQKVLDTINELQAEGFLRFPSDNSPTYGDRALTTIDYFMFSEGLKPSHFAIGSMRCCQHFPIQFRIELPVRARSSLDGNLN